MTRSFEGRWTVQHVWLYQRDVTFNFSQGFRSIVRASWLR